jgi:plastocyanin
VRRFLLATLLLPALLAGCGADDSAEPEEAGAPIRTVRIAETEFRLQPNTVRLDRAGTYVFEAVNDGTTDHALEVEGEGIEEETETIGPGESARLEVALEEGTYELYCPVGNHKDQGMVGEVVVGSGGGSPTTTEEEEEEDSGY